jgi:hypothetical protein
MKKVIVLSVGMMAAVAFGDIGLIWENPGFYTDEGGNYDVGPLTTQLIWSELEPATPTGASTDTAVTLSLGGLIASQGEVELDSGSYDYAQFLNTTPAVYADSDVGSKDVNAGWLFVRAWNQEGTYYAQSDALAPTLTEYDALTPSTIFDVKGEATGTLTDIEAIPEPATLGLMGIAGLGIYLARRKARC